MIPSLCTVLEVLWRLPWMSFTRERPREERSFAWFEKDTWEGKSRSFTIHLYICCLCVSFYQYIYFNYDDYFDYFDYYDCLPFCPSPLHILLFPFRPLLITLHNSDISCKCVECETCCRVDSGGGTDLYFSIEAVSSMESMSPCHSDHHRSTFL